MNPIKPFNPTTPDELDELVETHHDKPMAEQVRHGELQISTAHRTLCPHKYKYAQVLRKNINKQQITQMVDQGYRADQIANELGFSETSIRHFAHRNQIALIDRAKIRGARIDINRVIEQTILGLQNVMQGPELVTPKTLERIDSSRLPEWLASLEFTMFRLKKLIRQLKKEIA